MKEPVEPKKRTVPSKTMEIEYVLFSRTSGVLGRKYDFLLAPWGVGEYFYSNDQGSIFIDLKRVESHGWNKWFDRTLDKDFFVELTDYCAQFLDWEIVCDNWRNTMFIKTISPNPLYKQEFEEMRGINIETDYRNRLIKYEDDRLKYKKWQKQEELKKLEEEIKEVKNAIGQC